MKDFPMVAGRFEKVSLTNYMKSAAGTQEQMRAQYERIRLPRRATAGSAGYDFFADRDYEIAPGASAVIATGVCCRLNPGWFLGLYPRSGMGFRYGVRLANSVGIVDADFIEGETGGHILVKLMNRDSDQTVSIRAGDRFCQGVFEIHGIAQEEETTGRRQGGFGSTGA